MSVEAALYSVVSGAAGVSALVSARIYPGTLPQNVTLPAVKYERINTDIASAMSVDPGPYSARFQFSVFDEGSSAYLDVVAIIDAIKAACIRYRGTAGGTTIQDIFLMDESDLYEDDPARFGRALDVLVHYNA